jgi:MoxR-like ATPase
MFELSMPTPVETDVRRALVFDPDYHDVDALLERVTPEVLPWKELNHVGSAIQRSVSASGALERYVLDLWDATQAPGKFDIRIDGVDMSKLILAGASPRGIMSLTRAARVVAWFAGRDYLTPDDVRAVAPAVLGHRVFFTPVYELRRAQIADALVAQILDKVPTPR